MFLRFGIFLWLALALPVVRAEKPPQSGASPNEVCLACHGEKSLTARRKGKTIPLFVDAKKFSSSVHGSLACTSCHADLEGKKLPHGAPLTRVDCGACHAQPSADAGKSAHRALGAQACASCHGPTHEARRAASVTPLACVACHGEAVREYQTGVHASARRSGDVAGATCQSCHGPAHKVLAAGDPASPVAKKNLPQTCGACHANPQFLAKHQIPFARPVEAYRLSVHGRAVAAGNPSAAACPDCHSNHAILPARDPRSRINHWNVPATCGTCHTSIYHTYQQSIHGEAVQRGNPDAPVCTDCHGEHTILAPSEARSFVNPARVSTVTCGRCHGDERLTQRYNLPADKVPAYQESYHGLAQRAGSQTVANCASCHGVHNILPSSDPRSMVNPANVAHTCGTCHAGVGERFTIGPVHVRSATRTEHAAVRGIRVAYYILIPLTLGFMLLHNALDFFAKLIRGAGRRFAGGHTGEEVTRMNLHFRIAHWLVVITFPVLVITGFALKFPESWWAQPILRWEGRFALRGTLHRVAAVILIASLVYHLVHLIVSRRDRIILRFLRPGFQDLLDLIGVLRYNLGLSNARPVFGKFNYAEKAEYLAFIWGTVVMAISGFLLWFNNFSLRHFPKWVTDAATAVHYYEAILATLSILIWHFYITVFDPDVYPMDLAWLTGKVSADHLRETRPAYYLGLARQKKASEAAGDPPDAHEFAGSEGAASSPGRLGLPSGPKTSSPDAEKTVRKDSPPK